MTTLNELEALAKAAAESGKRFDDGEGTMSRADLVRLVHANPLTALEPQTPVLY